MFFNTLSGRFLGLTIIFVMIAEVLIFVPSVSRFRVDYLQNRLELAQLAALALLATPADEEVSEALESELLATADVFNVVLRRDEVRELVLTAETTPMATTTYDLRRDNPFRLMRGALGVYLSPRDQVIRVMGQARFGIGSEVEITMNTAPLRRAMIDYALRILYLSLAISLAVATLLFLAVRVYIVQPMRRVVSHMTLYRDDPEDASRIIEPESGVRELREAETALKDLQVRLTGSLRQKDRLAALGGAIAKISHDLRNLLTTAQLLADRIETSADPGVRRTAPKLVNSLARAIALCERTLTYGKAEETAPEFGRFPLAPLIEEVVENESAATDNRVPIAASVPDGLEVRADADQLFRVLTNLVRNAAQAILAAGGQGRIDVSVRAERDALEIRVSDTGPGLPPKARENLFKPFQGNARAGGAGLGLVIAAELVRGHGGALTLDTSTDHGTTFRITLPGALAA